jgi:hypothetical protein
MVTIINIILFIILFCKNKIKKSFYLSNEDIVIDNNFLPYKEKIFMTFPKKEHSNNNKIILKRNSIIFFEFKVSFPQFTWKNKFSHLLKK